MADKAVGSIVMSVDGLEYDCASLSVNQTVNNKPIPTMNRRQRIKYVASGIRVYEISCSVVIPDGKDTVDWAEVENVRISVESVTGNFRETYIDCGITSIGSSYDVNGETKRDLSLYACDLINESF
ncbi:hypothetical protein ACG93T_17010 [Acinetobacter beijerinckii]|uniref:hypothetical protein n=1 Tax=Acinetobacter beijerinckii TaxID=262668 RepID=UPI003AF7A3FE